MYIHLNIWWNIPEQFQLCYLNISPVLINAPNHLLAWPLVPPIRISIEAIMLGSALSNSWPGVAQGKGGRSKAAEF